MGRKHVLCLLLMVAVLIFTSAVTIDDASAVNLKSKKQTVSTLKKAVKEHKKTVTVYSKSKFYPWDLFDRYVRNVNPNWTVVYKEGKSSRGDYYRMGLLKNVHSTYWVYRYENGKVAYYKYKWTITYYETKKHSNYIDKRSKSVAKKYKKKSQKKKALAINTWLVKNMRYKVTNKWGIYDAYKNKRGQCHHYALMYYKMAKDAGLEARVISGDSRSSLFDSWGGHAWCIVKIGNKWYNIDPTWADDGSTVDSKFVLKGKNNVIFNLTHRPDPEFDSAYWNKTHPMAN